MWMHQLSEVKENGKELPKKHLEGTRKGKYVITRAMENMKLMKSEILTVQK